MAPTITIDERMLEADVLLDTVWQWRGYLEDSIEMPISGDLLVQVKANL